MSKARKLSPLAMDVISQIATGKLLSQLRAERPELTSAKIASIMKEVEGIAGPNAFTKALSELPNTPATQRASMPIANALFKLRIDLKDVKPPIWRRFTVPVSITLEGLHDVIQTVMGWSNSHLHSFTIGGEDFVMDADEAGYGEEEAGVVLSSLVRAPRTKFEYLYDFGDGWSHKILVEAVEEIREGTPPITCLTGKRNCPPEDVGGPWGYAQFMKAMADPKDKEHKSYKKWYGGKFDPEEFDVDVVNSALGNIPRIMPKQGHAKRSD